MPWRDEPWWRTVQKLGEEEDWRGCWRHWRSGTFERWEALLVDGCSLHWREQAQDAQAWRAGLHGLLGFCARTWMTQSSKRAYVWREDLVGEGVPKVHADVESQAQGDDVPEAWGLASSVFAVAQPNSVKVE